MFRLTFDDSGFRQLQQRLQAIGSHGSIAFSDLFAPSFMGRHTRLCSFEALIEAGGFEVESKQDFVDIPDAEWERVVQANTSFQSWEEMQTTATNEWIQRQLDS